MNLDLYKFKYNEFKELTFSELKLYSILRQACINEKEIQISPIELGKYFEMNSSSVSRTLKSLQEKKKLKITNIGREKIIYINDVFEDGEEYNFFVMEDFKKFGLPYIPVISQLTYNEFKIFTTIRSYSRKFGYATFTQKVLAEKTGIDKFHLSSIITDLSIKGVICYNKILIDNRKCNFWKLFPDWDYISSLSP